MLPIFSEHQEQRDRMINMWGGAQRKPSLFGAFLAAVTTRRYLRACAQYVPPAQIGKEKAPGAPEPRP